MDNLHRIAVTYMVLCYFFNYLTRDSCGQIQCYTRCHTLNVLLLIRACTKCKLSKRCAHIRSWYGYNGWQRKWTHWTYGQNKPLNTVSRAMTLKETTCVLKLSSTEQIVIVYKCLFPIAILFQLLAVNFEVTWLHCLGNQSRHSCATYMYLGIYTPDYAII